MLFELRENSSTKFVDLLPPHDKRLELSEFLWSSTANDRLVWIPVRNGAPEERNFELPPRHPGTMESVSHGQPALLPPALVRSHENRRN